VYHTIPPVQNIYSDLFPVYMTHELMAISS
jgi:hypothetical protein